MRKTAILSFVVATLVGLLPAGARAAGPHVVDGQPCRASVFGEGTYEVDGGPLVVANDDGTPATARLICTIQDGGRTHADPDFASATSAETTGVVALPPTLLQGPPTFPNDPHLCSQLHFADGTDLYWNASEITGREWTTDPTVICAGFVCPGDGCECSIETGCPDDDDPFVTVVDPIVCPVFASLAPGVPGVVDIEAEGDVALLGAPFWDCPPYHD